MGGREWEREGEGGRERVGEVGLAVFLSPKSLGSAGKLGRFLL